MNLLALDSRWRRLHDPEWISPKSGRSFGGLIDIGYDHPDPWPHGDLAECGQDVLEVGADKLSADLCRCDGMRFVRAMLALPINGSDEAVQFAIWVHVGDADFYRYLEDATGETPGFAGCAAWLMNDIPGFESDTPFEGQLIPGGADERPTFEANDGPLKQAQAEGISFEALLDLYAATGNDIRADLTG
ncbi:DUF2199 domain-containing protein [Shimia sp. MMG029]|uniref:DUF2199 domain-containing protein n=1 Tax=Shimia sp. MMG029 TaxID=3021978 RepID=UPI0022FF1FAD|nr:DUF2199 domain-containing protein [Shimia sp. MMG029]MDA5557893.1 DUF2199 domain-containing protein [Shimia sp. MMG029]